MNKREEFIRTVELPRKIKELMVSGLWIAMENCPLNEELQKYFRWDGKVMLYNNLEKVDCGLLATSEGNAKEFYGTYRTDEKEDKLNLDWIDANKSIMVACNYDEEAICIDYRFSKKSPRIVATYYANSSKRNGRWKEIATNEEELIKKLGINI